MRVDVTVLAVLVKDCTLVGVLAEPVDTIVHDEVGVRVLDPLVLVVNLVLLLEHDQRGVDLLEPGLNRNKEGQVLAELILLVIGKLGYPLERLLVREEDLKSHEHTSVLISVDVHPDLIPKVSELRADLEIVLHQLT